MKKSSKLLIYSSLPPVGGHSTITLKIIEAFRKDFDEILVFTRNLPGHGLCEAIISNLRAQNIPVEKVGENGPLGMPISLNRFLSLRRQGVETFLCVGMRGLSPIMAKALGAQRSIYYHITHTNEEDDFRRLAKYSTAFDTIAVISPLSLEPLQKMPGLASETVWIPQISELPNALSSARLAGETPVSIGFLGRVSEAKGVALLLDLWRDTPPSADLHLMGAGELEAQVGALVSASADRKEGRIWYHGSFSASERDAALSKFFEKIDYLIVPSIVEGEGLPTVILEALQYGLPILTTPIGGTACFDLEWLRPADPRVVVLEQPAKLAASIRTMSAQPRPDAALQASCRAYYEKWFATPVVRKSWEAVLLASVPASI